MANHSRASNVNKTLIIRCEHHLLLCLKSSVNVLEGYCTSSTSSVRFVDINNFRERDLGMPRDESYVHGMYTMKSIPK